MKNFWTIVRFFDGKSLVKSLGSFESTTCVSLFLGDHRLFHLKEVKDIKDRERGRVKKRERDERRSMKSGLSS